MPGGTALARATRVRGDHFKDPLDLAQPRPLYAWALADLGKGRRQLAGQVLVATDPKLLEPGPADVWDSGTRGMVRLPVGV